MIGGRRYLLQCDASWQVSPDNRTSVQLNWTSVSGRRILTEIPVRIPVGRSNGLKELSVPLIAPEGAYDLQVGLITNRQGESDYFELRRVTLGELVVPRESMPR